MKAIIMAGGEGVRLRPVSVNEPKPMTPFFDRPLLTHTLNLLKKHDIHEACLTLRFLPESITGHFGDGTRFGMRLSHKIEKTPLGTAGGVKACADFIGGEPVLILSGDAICDFDLQACIAFHEEKKSDATIVLYAHPEPLEYGLVMTDKTGKVERFIEKPPWSQVFTNRINTGIYILSPRVLAEIPEGVNYDFGRDLFPHLLEKGFALYGVEAEGYWCDIGSPEAYRQSAMDALDQKLELDFGIPPRGQALWSHSPVPPDVTVKHPCYIGKDVVLESGANIGPHAVIGAGSHIGAGAKVVRSIVNGANLGQNVRLEGAIVCQGASLREGSILNEGTVIGSGTILGEGTVVAPKIRIWPHKELPPGSRVTENLVSGLLRSGLRFDRGGAIRGEASVDITPEACFAIGSALGKTGRVGISVSGEAGARLAGRSIACGVVAAGGSAIELDGGFEAVTSYGADLYGLDKSVFVRQTSARLELRVYGQRGLPLRREEERKIEAALSAGEFHRADVNRTGEMLSTLGTLEAYIAAAASWGDLGKKPNFPVEIRGLGGAKRAMQRALERMGTEITTRSQGVVAFETARGGMVLRAEDEEGHILEPERLLAILVMLEFESGEKIAAVPYAAPVALDQLAKKFGAKILRLGRDRDAEDLYYRLPYLRDAIFAACRLTGSMAASGETLHDFNQRAPQFHTANWEVTVTGDRAAIMQKLAGSMSAMSAELVEGLRLPTEGGWVHISPSAKRPVLKIRGEGANMEAAEEICFDFARKVEGLV